MFHGVLEIPYIAGPGILEKGFQGIRGYRLNPFLNVTTTLMLHATLLLFKSATIHGFHPSISIHKHYLKVKHYGSQYTEHGSCLSIRRHSVLVEDRIGVREYLSGKIQVERSLLDAWRKTRFICPDVFSRRTSRGNGTLRRYLFAVFGGFTDGQSYHCPVIRQPERQ